MRRLAVLSICAMVVLGACGPGSSDDGHVDSPQTARYVALGDSLTSGPGIEPMSRNQPECQRSTVNYPALVAEELSIDLLDVSCGGATTIDVLSSPQTAARVTTPQVEAVTAETELVTISIGGNNGFATPLWTNCIFAAKPEATCPDLVSKTLPDRLPTIATAVGETLDEVAARAPQATIVLVGYLSFAPGGQNCDALPTPSSALRRVDAAQREFETLLEETAKAHGALFVPMGQYSADHGPCSEEPWTNGVDGSNGDGEWLHPTSAGMEAISDAVVSAVESAESHTKD